MQCISDDQNVWEESTRLIDLVQFKNNLRFTKTVKITEISVFILRFYNYNFRLTLQTVIRDLSFIRGGGGLVQIRGGSLIAKMGMVTKN